jgi:hypothetical protein
MKTYYLVFFGLYPGSLLRSEYRSAMYHEDEDRMEVLKRVEDDHEL